MWNIIKTIRLEYNEDGNPLCPKCGSDNMRIHEEYQEVSIRGNTNYRGLYGSDYECLDCNNTSFRDHCNTITGS